jgi:hypothetical protein
VADGTLTIHGVVLKAEVTMADGSNQIIELGPIGVVRAPRVTAVDDHRGGIESVIALDARRIGPLAMRTAPP